jgi:UDP:flavonoid glycosyltransferase YjiC (YdhE family)
MTQRAKKILFIVNGLGLGNSTRCDSIAQRLARNGCEIDVMTSGNGLLYFRGCSYVANVVELRSVYYGSKHGKLSMWNTLFAIPDLLMILKANVNRLKALLANNSYAALVIDSDYMVWWLKKAIRIPIIALNNADIVIQECNKLPVLPKAIRMQYVVERCDGWFHRTVPQLVLSPSILKQDDGPGKVKHFAPFIREGLVVRPPTTDLKRILVMLSGSGFGSKTDFVKQWTPPPGVSVDVVGRDGMSQDSITYHGKTFVNQSIVNQADMMVVNGGFSAVSEAVVLRKPVIVIPVENHAEQFINASIIERAGLGLVATEDNVVDKMREMMARFGDFVESHRQFGCETDGAARAARLIDEVSEPGQATS